MSDNISPKKVKGFTIIEVLIFVTISSVILVSIISLSVTVTRQTYINIHKFYATRYADELAEWLRTQKELNWQAFYNTVSGYVSPYTRCVNATLGLTSDLAILTATSPCPYGLDTIYSRTVRFTDVSDAQVSSNSAPIKAQIKVTWLEVGGMSYDVTFETLFAPR